ncbi:MAG: SDR family oxidoreductase [Bradymonadales bacterium]|nr:SDR family oxidoreductase [Bradymonadales bacterium]
MQILILGGAGMLGHKMLQTLQALYSHTRCTIRGALDDPFYRRIDLFTPSNTIEQVDAMDLAELEGLLTELQPDVLVNCIGIVKQREEATAAIPSITLNALLPHLLADWAGCWGGRVIHFSTDCVFSGKRGRYREADPSDAEDLYGKTKFLGEVASGNALTLRTSIIGRELSHFQSLLEWFLAQRRKSIRGYTRVIYSGVTTNYLAELVGRIIGQQPGLSGLYQVTAPAISKYELLCRLKEAYGIEVEILPDDHPVSDRSMIGDRFLQATGWTTPSWDDLVDQLVGDPTPYDRWR